jgi:hypothetical protein
VRPAYYTDSDGATTDALVMWIHDVDDPAFDDQFEKDQS